MTTQWNRDNGGAGALEFARQLTGAPYVYGGEWPSSGGTDCSGLVEWAYSKVGVLLPRTTELQYKLHPLAKSAKSEPGDLLFIEGSPIDANPGHVMMFVAEGEVFEAEETGTRIGQLPYDTDEFEFRTRPALALALPKKPATKKPTAAQLAKAGLVVLANPTQAHTALDHGWTLYVWSGWGFVATATPEKKGTPQYANRNFRRKRAA